MSDELSQRRSPAEILDGAVRGGTHSIPTSSDLLRLCDLPADAPEDVVELVRLAAVLVERSGDGPAAAAVALVAAMGRAGGWSVQDLPFGYEGPRVEYKGWIKRDDVALKLAQVGGMIVGGRFNAEAANEAVAEALHNYWLREQPFDTWRPGMKSGSGWTTVVQAQPAGLAGARELAAAPAESPRLWPAPLRRPQPTPKSAGERQLEWLAKAMLTVRGHPDWSDAKIAEHVGKHPGTLSRSKEYQTAAKLARESKTDRPKGFVTKDPDSRAIDVDGVTPDSGAADVEEADPPTALADDCSDRGKPIPGSRYVREYCAQCKAKIRVTPDKVGTKPLCEECAK